MALIHEQIYQSPDHAHINLKNYIIEEYQEIFKQNKNIKLDYNMENILIDMDTAIPLGLILSEILSEIAVSVGSFVFNVSFFSSVILKLIMFFELRACVRIPSFSWCFP